ncbi:MAG: tetratricopeptide repeat protein [Deltaproteobacteria bacterium]|nr:tetratricopeptide repeat protein [Deltaproteobacteria bacterium]
MGKKEIILAIGLVVLSLAVGIVIGKMRGTSVEERDITKQPAPQSSANQPSFAQHDYTAEVQRILKERPNDARAFAEVGSIYFDQHKFTDAIEYYKKAVAMDPEDVNSYNDLGLSYHYIGMSDEGLKYVEEGIKKNPAYQRIWLTKGFILAIKGNIADARSAWEKAYKMDPNSDVGRSAASFLEQYKGAAR